VTDFKPTTPGREIWEEASVAHVHGEPSTGALNLGPSGKIVVLLTAAFPAFVMAGMLPVLPVISAFFAGTPHVDVITRLLVTVTGFMVMIFAPIMGTYMDRFGGRRLIVVAISAFALAGGCGLFLENIYWLLASRFVVGWGLATIGALMLVLVVRYSSGTAHNRWFGYVTMVAASSSIVIMPIGGFLGHYGWHWPFILYILMLPLAYLAQIGFPPDPPYVPKPKDAAAAGQPASRPEYGFLLFAFICGFTLTAPYLYVPFKLRDIGVSDPELIGLVTIPASIMGGVVAFAYGWLRARMSITALFVVVFGFATAGQLLVATSTTYFGVVFGMFVFSIATGISAPNVYAYATNLGHESRRAQTMGFSKTGLYGGPILSQFVLEPVIAKFATQGALLCIAAVALVMLVRELWRFRLERTAPVTA
jgi:MFS family permease